MDTKMTLTFQVQTRGLVRSYGNLVDLYVCSINVLRSLDSGTTMLASHKSVPAKTEKKRSYIIPPYMSIDSLYNLHITHTALSVDTRVGQRDGRAERFAFDVVIRVQRVGQDRWQGGALDFAAGRRSSSSFLQSDQERRRQRWRLVAAAAGGGRIRFVGLPQSLEEERQQVRDSRKFLFNPRLYI